MSLDVARDLSLAEYLRQVAGTPFSRGGCDCCTFLADWVLARTGIDPAEGLRGYSNDRGAMLRIGRAGGFLELVTERVEAAGARRVQTPAAGDVGVVKLVDRYTCAIFTGTSWAVKEGDGLMLGLFEPLAIWRP